MERNDWLEELKDVLKELTRYCHDDIHEDNRRRTIVFVLMSRVVCT